MLVALIFCSLVQDVVYFLMNRDVEEDDGEEDDRGTVKKIKMFSRFMGYISFGWRVSDLY